MKKFSFICLCLLIVSPLLFADLSTDAIESKGGVISASDVAGETILGLTTVLLINDGPNSVFILNNSQEAVSTADFELANGESIVLESTSGKEIQNVRYICAAGETASIRYLSWD